jgi:hypothetical protein
MVALCRAAGISPGSVLIGRAVDDRCVVIGVTQARGGRFRQYRLNRRAGLGGQPAGEARHAVAVLVAQGQSAPARAILVGVGTVGVQVGGEPFSQFG